MREHLTPICMQSLNKRILGNDRAISEKTMVSSYPKKINGSESSDCQSLRPTRSPTHNMLSGIYKTKDLAKKHKGNENEAVAFSFTFSFRTLTKQ